MVEWTITASLELWSIWGDEGPIDLELVHGQALEVGHGRIAGAEVVDRELHAHGVEASEDLQGVDRVGHDGALGELDDQQRCGHLVAVPQLADLVGKLQVEQTPG